MTADHPNPRGEPERRPGANDPLPGPLVPALFSLGLTVGAIVFLSLNPTGASLVMAAIAMFFAVALLVGWIWLMLNEPGSGAAPSVSRLTRSWGLRPHGSPAWATCRASSGATP